MASYTKLDENDIRTISTKYGLVVTEFEAMAGGAGNSSYHLHTSSGNYVLTVLDSQSVNGAIRLGKLLTYLIDHKFPTTEAIPQLNGDIIQVYKGQALLLKHYIVGTVMIDSTPEMMWQVGQAMAQLHQIPAPDFVPENALYGMEAFSEFNNTEINPDFVNWTSHEIAMITERLNAGNLPRGLIHGDLFADNVLFQGEQLQAFIDFEAVCNYYLIFDLGTVIVGMCCHDKAINWRNIQSFIVAYENIRNLSSAEKESLQISIQFAAITTACWRFWQYQIHLPEPDKADKYLEMVHIAKLIAEIPPDEFQQKCFIEG